MSKRYQQYTLMKFDPASGSERPYPSHADQYREYHGNVAWLYNPWNGDKRHPGDIGSDITGQLIIPDNENVKSMISTKNNEELKRVLALNSDEVDALNSTTATVIVRNLVDCINELDTRLQEKEAS